MCRKIVVLQGGENVAERTHIELFRKITRISRTKKMLIIPWTSESREKEMKYRNIYRKYFIECGFETVQFLEHEDTDQEITEKMSGVDVLYLPGGDTDVLYRKIRDRSLENWIREFCGIIIGNSAGAIVLSKGSFKNGKIQPGFGIVDIFTRVHYGFQDEDMEAESEFPVIGLPENAWITVSPSNRT